MYITVFPLGWSHSSGAKARGPAKCERGARGISLCVRVRSAARQYVSMCLPAQERLLRRSTRAGLGQQVRPGIKHPAWPLPGFFCAILLDLFVNIYSVAAHSDSPIV